MAMAATARAKSESEVLRGVYKEWVYVLIASACKSAFYNAVGDGIGATAQGCQGGRAIPMYDTVLQGNAAAIAGK